MHLNCAMRLRDTRCPSCRSELFHRAPASAGMAPRADDRSRSRSPSTQPLGNIVEILRGRLHQAHRLRQAQTAAIQARANAPRPIWTRYVTSENRHYYYNRMTDVTQWRTPPNFDAEQSGPATRSGPNTPSPPRPSSHQQPEEIRRAFQAQLLAREQRQRERQQRP